MTQIAAQPLATDNHAVPTAAGVAPDAPPLLDIREVAAALGVGERFVRRIIAERRVPHYKLGGKIRFAASDLEQYLQASRREAVRSYIHEESVDDVIAFLES